MPRSDFTLAVLHSFSKNEICAHKLLADTAEVSFAQYIFHNTQRLLPFLTFFFVYFLVLDILYFRALHVSTAPSCPQPHHLSCCSRPSPKPLLPSNLAPMNTTNQLPFHLPLLYIILVNIPRRPH